MGRGRPRNHERGSAGERRFVAAIPTAWLASKPEDYGIDYELRVAEDFLVNEVRVVAQVKTGKRKGGDVVVRVEGADLAYWLHEEHLPVLLVGYCEAEDAVFFADVDHLRLPALWADKGEVSVRLPASAASRVDNHASLRQVVRAAWGRRQGPAAAIARRERALQALDPRFQVQVTATVLGEAVRIAAKETVRARLVATLDADRQKLLAQGEAVPFAAGEISFEGSRLLASLVEHGGSLQMAQKRELTLTLRRTGGSGPVLRLPCTSVRGLTAIKVEAHDSGCPLSVALTCTLSGDRIVDTRGSVVFDESHWEGFHPLRLPWYDAVAALFEAASKDDVIDVGLEIRDQSQVFAWVSPSDYPRALHVLRVVALTREVARAYPGNYVMPVALEDDVEQSVERAHALLVGTGEHRSPGHRWTFSGEPAAPFRRKRGEFGYLHQTYTRDDPFVGSVEAMGQVLPVDLVAITLTKCSVRSSGMKAGRRWIAFESRTGELIERSVRWQGTNEPPEDLTDAQ